MKTTTGLFFATALCAAVASAGECTRTFAWLANEGVSDFQVPVSFREGVDGFSYVGFADRTGGTDLRVSDGTSALAYEIENWDPDGESVVWVKAPAFSKTTELHFSWGDATAPSVSGNIWTDMNLVMHLAKGAMDSSPSALAGAGKNPDPNPGAVGIGLSGRDQQTKSVAVTGIPADKAVSGTAFTVSSWVKAPTVSTSLYLSQNTDGNNQYYSLVYNYRGTGKLSLYFTSKGVTGDTPYRDDCSFSVAAGAWHHVAFTYDGTTFKGYLDGYEKFSKALTFSVTAAANNGTFRVGNLTSDQAFPGLGIDEFRLEHVCRSAAWIRAACETQHALVAGHCIEVDVAANYTADDVIADFPAYAVVDSACRGFSAFGREIFDKLKSGKAVVTDAASGAAVPYEVELVRNDGAREFAGIWARLPAFSKTSRLRVSGEATSVYPAASAAAAVSGSVWPDSSLVVAHLEPAAYRKESVTGSQVFRAPAGGDSLQARHAVVADEGPTGPCLAARTGTNTAVTTLGPGGGDPLLSARPLTNVFTISFWARSDAYALGPRDVYMMQIYDKSGQSAVQRAIISGYNPPWSINKLSFYNCESEGTRLEVPDAGWHHYVFTQSWYTQKLYRDGELVGSNGVKVDFNVTDLSKCQLAIGGTAGAGNAWQGAVDEFRIEDVVRPISWIRACYRNQRAFANGRWQLATPHFDEALSATGAANAIVFSGGLGCLKSAEVRFFYGTADAGTDAGAWANSVAASDLGSGNVSATVEGLAADAKVVGRFAARNDASDGWVFSGPVAGRTNPPEKCARAKVRFNYAGVTLANFPVPVRVPAANGLPSDPQCLRVVDTAGRALPFEIERWNPSGESVIWVRLPELCADAEVWLVWHKSWAGEAIWATSEPWDGDYACVCHLGSGNGDSSRDGCATPVEATSGTYGTGVIGEAVGFDATAGSFRFNERTCGDFINGFSLSFWAKIDDPDATAGTNVGTYLFTFEGSNWYAFSGLFNYNSKSTNALCLYDTFFLKPVGGHDNLAYDASPIQRPDAQWHHYCWNYSGRKLVCYRDGIRTSQADFPIPGGKNWFAQSNKFYLTLGTEKFRGAFDECRFERTSRSDAWIRACYDSQRPGSGFATVGGTERIGMVLILR